MDKALRITESTLPTHKAKSLMTRHDAKEKGSCIECGSEIPIRDTTRGELICSQCGLVLSSNLIDLGPEWRAFTKEQSDQRRRVGKPINFARSDKGLTTTLGWGYSDASGRAIPANRRADISRMRKWQRRVQRHTSYERNLAVAMTELSRVTSQMNLPNMVKDSVAIIYRRILRNNLIRGRTIEGIIGACVYIACRTHRIPLTLREISHHSRIKAKKLGRCYRFIVQKFDVRIPQMLPQDFIPRFGEALRVPARVQRRAKEILAMARKNLITSGKAPSGLAAASLYIASILEGDHRTQREIADVAEITEVTIRNRYKELVEKLNL